MSVLAGTEDVRFLLKQRRLLMYPLIIYSSSLVIHTCVRIHIGLHDNAQRAGFEDKKYIMHANLKNWPLWCIS